MYDTGIQYVRDARDAPNVADAQGRRYLLLDVVWAKGRNEIDSNGHE